MYWTKVVAPEGAIVFKYTYRQFFDERTVREAYEELLAQLPEGELKLVVNLSVVRIISSSALTKLILLLRRVDDSHGKLRLCEMSAVVQSVFHTSNLDRLFSITPTEKEAIDQVSSS